MAQAIIGSVQTTDPWGAYDPNAVERDPSVYPRQIDESTRRQTVVNYTPTTVAAPSSIYEDMMRQAFERSQQTPAPPQPQGPTPYWENPATYYPRQQMPDPVEQSKAATAAAYKYIAFRGYQQDLKEGKSAADAFAKWGPMLVQDTSFAPAMKAMRPEPTPTWMPADPSTGRPGTWVANGRVTVPPAQGQETVVQPTGNMPGYIRDARGGIKFFPNERGNEISPTTALNTIVDPSKWPFAQQALGSESTNLVNIAKSGLQKSQQLSAPKAPITISSKAEYDKLGPGTYYMNKGKLHRKPS